MLKRISRSIGNRGITMLNNRMGNRLANVAILNNGTGNRLASVAMINKITTKISVFLDQKVCGIPMIEMIGLRILCYILIAVMIARILE